MEEIISEAFSLINQPFKFIRGDLARNKKDVAVDPTELNAIKFDMIGALTKVREYRPEYEGIECVTYPPAELEKDMETLTKLAHKAFPHCKGYSLGPINDLLSYDELIELFTLLFYGAR